MPWKAPQEKIEGSAWSSNRIRTKPVPTNKIGKTCKSWDIEVSTQEVLVPEWAWLQTHLTNNEVKMKVLVTQSCPILCDPEDYRLLCPWDYPGKTTGVGSYSFLPGDLPNPGIKARSPALAGRFFTIWATREARGYDRKQTVEGFRHKDYLHRKSLDFPGGPVVKTSTSSKRGEGSIPGWGAKIPRASRPENQNIKWKQYCTRFNKDFKNGPHLKKIIIKNKIILYKVWLLAD